MVSENLRKSRYGILILYMRYLGIDYGSKKIGLALSDESGAMAFPLSVEPNDGQFMQKLTKLVEEKGVAEIVIGNSQNLEGKDNVIQESINAFIGDITLHIGIPVHLESELYTTKEAERIQGKSGLTDASAAAIILNSFLSKQ